MFGSRVTDAKQREVQRIIQITSIGGGGKYLGLPEEFTRKKIQMFDYIVKKVKERTRNWNNKFLSEGGKEVLLKSFALAMLTYAMSCFKLPITITNEINSLLSQFWWGSDENKRRISWVSWKKLSYPKKEGGLGFKDIEKFNDALLAKQAWRLLKHPDCLLAKVLKSRYFPESSIESARLGRKPSHGWRSILCGRDLLIRGLRHRIGNNSTFHPASANWLPVHPPRPVVDYQGPANSTIADLKQANGKQWDSTRLSQWLTEEDADLVRRIYIPQHPCDDKIIWHYTTNGVYSVKSGYWLANHLPESPVPLISDGCTQVKAKVWKLNIPPKLKHFIWRALSRALSTGTELNRCGIPIDPLCPRCRQDDEYINHLLFHCPYADSIWRSSSIPIPSLTDPSTSIHDNLEALVSLSANGRTTELKHLPVWILWHIWKSRNDLVFNKVNWNADAVLQKATNDVSEWIATTDHQMTNSTTNTPPSSPHDNGWQSPRPGYVKINFDGSFNYQTQQTGAGWIIRNDIGEFCLAGCSKLLQAFTPLESEAITLLHAIQASWCRGFRRIVVEGDCKILIDILHGRSIFSTLEHLITDIRSWANRFTEIQFSFISRECNKLADRLAKTALIQAVTSQTFSIPPNFLRRLLYLDTVNIQS